MSPTRALLEHVDTALIDTVDRKPATTRHGLWADGPERGAMNGRATVAELSTGLGTITIAHGSDPP